MNNSRYFLAVLPIIFAGCSAGSKMSENEQVEFEKSINVGKEKLDPESLPPEVREKVKGFMEANRPATAGG